MPRFLILPAVLLSTVPTQAAEPFELKDGDRVVLIGNTLIEREQRYGYWEAALTSRWPDRNITFRNLGWSGDTVFGDARAGFGKPADGFRRLIELTLALKPTVILIAYGGNEAFDGPAGLPRFEKGLTTLLDALAPAKARTVLLSPPPVASLGPPLPDAGAHNKNLGLYRDAIKAAAAARGLRFADLLEQLGPVLSQHGSQLTDNGMHFDALGYQRTAALFEKCLGLPERKESLSAEQAEKLRRAIVAKNEQFFHRWRPQNETYLFGFRKHEQGKNAAEIPQFDPIIAKLEADIARLRKRDAK